MHNKKYLLLINSTVAFILAAIIAITLHETAHLIAGKMLRLDAIFYPTAVDFGKNSSVNDSVITALAGPLFSLIFGLLLIRFGRNWGKGFRRLLWLWLGYISAQIGFGYFLIAYFAPQGDTGLVLKLLSAPAYAYVSLFLMGLFGMIWLARMFAGQAIRYTNDANSLRQIGLFAWIVGTGILLVIYTAASRNVPTQVVPTILAGVGTVGIFTPMLTFFYKKLHAPYEDLKLSFPYAQLAIVAFVSTVVIGILATGMKF